MLDLALSKSLQVAQFKCSTIMLFFRPFPIVVKTGWMFVRVFPFLEKYPLKTTFTSHWESQLPIFGSRTCRAQLRFSFGSDSGTQDFEKTVSSFRARILEMSFFFYGRKIKIWSHI